jgi:hypothetical protein
MQMIQDCSDFTFQPVHVMEIYKCRYTSWKQIKDISSEKLKNINIVYIDKCRY